MKNLVKALLILSTAMALSACGDETTGQACMGSNNDSLIETLQGKCKAGDTIATKHPAYFCDFNYAIAYNDYNSAFCIYSGSLKPERTAEKTKG